MTADLSFGSEHATVLQGHGAFGHIPAGQTGTSPAPFVFQVDPAVPDHESLAPAFQVSAEPWTILAHLEAHAPEISPLSIEVDDSATGNQNRRIDPGELVRLEVVLDNAGSCALNSIDATLACAQPAILITSGAGQIPEGLPPGRSAQVRPPFELYAQPTCTEPHACFTLLVAGPQSYARSFEFRLPIGGFYAAAEHDTADWVHQAASPGHGDQWHVSTERNHSAYGLRSWKCGDPGAGPHGDDLDAALVSPVVELGSYGELVFWHWMEAEESSMYPGEAYDGGLVEIAAEGGAWIEIEPDGGYTHVARNRIAGPGPFPTGTPFYSGSFGWTRARFDLAPFSGRVQIRFRFGSDYAAGFEGWHIDDIFINGLAQQTCATDGSAAIPAGRMLPARPNPMIDATRLILALEGHGPTELRVFDATGRCVRTLLDGPAGPGTRDLLWNGRDETGLRVPAGCYYIDFGAGGSRTRQPILVVH